MTCPRTAPKMEAMVVEQPVAPTFNWTPDVLTQKVVQEVSIVQTGNANVGIPRAANKHGFTPVSDGAGGVKDVPLAFAGPFGDTMEIRVDNQTDYDVWIYDAEKGNADCALHWNPHENLPKSSYTPKVGDDKVSVLRLIMTQEKLDTAHVIYVEVG